MEKSKTKQISTRISILGLFNPSVKQLQQLLPSISFQNAMKSYMAKSDQVNPKKIVVEDNNIAIIDDDDNVWLINETFNQPINISMVLRKKANEIALNQKQLIMQTKRGPILVNWGGKKLFHSDQLQQIMISDKSWCQHIFQAFFIRNTTTKDKFIVTNMKKSQNSNKLYHILDENQSQTKIQGYPTNQTISMNKKIVGVSIGKFHCLCWDQMGSLYSWGNKSIALGYVDIPRQTLITQPNKIQCLNCFVTTAFAATHYSLALGSDGTLYEWGIKRQINQINDELIFYPKPLINRYIFTDCKRKFIALKGKNDNFAAVTLKGQFYVWGKSGLKFLCQSDKQLIPKHWVNGRLYQPIRVSSLQNSKIIDFAIEENYISIITTNKLSSFMMKEQMNYWNVILNNIKLKWLSNLKKVKTQGQQIKFKKTFSDTVDNSGFQSFVLNKTQNTPNKVQSYINSNQFKKNYMQMVKDEPTLFQYIMNPSSQSSLQKKSTKSKAINHRKLMKRKEHNIWKKIQNRVSEEVSESDKIIHNIFRNSQNNVIKAKMQLISIDLQQTKHYIQRNQPYKKTTHIKNFSKLQFTPRENTFQIQKSIRPYTQRLKEAQSKRKFLQQESFEHFMNKLKNNQTRNSMTKSIIRG